MSNTESTQVKEVLSWRSKAGAYLNEKAGPVWVGLCSTVIVVGVFAIIYLLYLVVASRVNPKTPTENNEVIRTVVQIIGALVLAVGGVFTFLTYRENELANRKREHLTLEGQIADRYTKAIEQLASEEVAIRLGGIYALERIANDSDRDYRTVMEVLTAFVREKGRKVWVSIPQAFATVPVLHQPGSWSIQQPKPPEDIQAIIAVISRRKYHYGGGEYYPLDLSFADLRGVQFMKANLEGVTFYRAHLESALFVDVIAKKTYFAESFLNTATFWGECHLEGSNFNNAHVDSVDFTRSHLDEALFTGVCHFESSVFKEAILPKINLSGAFNLRPQQIPREYYLHRGITWPAHLLEELDIERNKRLDSRQFPEVGSEHLAVDKQDEVVTPEGNDA